jgi:cytochrome c-type biogenesis protein CcmE
MKKNGRFMVGLVGVAAVVTYLIWTGVSETMVYYLTPVELMERVEADPSFHEVGVKVSGQVIPGSYQRKDGELLHVFDVHDLEDESVTFTVEYRDALPDTFSEDVEVVLEGRLRSDGVFEATTLLTKCGSRYEAAPEDLAG